MILYPAQVLGSLALGLFSSPENHHNEHNCQDQQAKHTRDQVIQGRDSATGVRGRDG